MLLSGMSENCKTLCQHRYAGTRLWLVLLFFSGFATAGDLEWQERKENIPSWIKGVAEFTTLEVPEKRNATQPNTIQLAVARAKAREPKGNPPIVYLAGGPGSSAIGAANGRYLAPLFERLNQHHDLIFMDQRGTGRSKPNLQFPSKNGLPQRFFADETIAFNHFKTLHLAAKKHFESQGIDITAYNSIESADDIEALRQAVGAEKLVLFGFSYGTHLGLTMLKRHPKRVARAVLVGCEGLEQTLKLPSTYDAQLNKLAFLAKADPHIGSKVPDLEGLVKKVLTKLAAEPIMVPIVNRAGETLKTVPVGAFGLQLILRMDIGDGNDFPDFPRLLHGLAQGDASKLTPYVTKRYFQLGRGVSVMSIVMDLASGVSPDRLARIKRESETCFLGPFVNMGSERMLEIYPGIDLGDDFRKPFNSQIPTLFISGQMDSNTPPFQAEQLRWRFSQGRHVTLEYGGHEDMLPHPEIQKLIAAFIAQKPVKDQVIYQEKPKFRPID